MPAFSKKEAISFGWTTFKAHWKFLIVLTILVAIINYGPGSLLNYFNEQQELPIVVIIGAGLVIWLIQLLVALGRMRILLNIVDGKSVSFRILVGEKGLLIRYFIGSLLYGVLVILASVAFIVPGIYVAIRFQFWAFELVDKGLGTRAALRASWEATKGSVINLFLYNIVVVLISGLGILIVGVGLLVTYPVTLLATTWVYRKLFPYPAAKEI